MKRQIWVSPDAALPLTRQCALAGVARATIYARHHPKAPNTTDLTHRRLIDEEYTHHPFYGTRRMVTHLKRAGHAVNRKRVQRLTSRDKPGSAQAGVTNRGQQTGVTANSGQVFQYHIAPALSLTAP